ncbi:MAG TPA: hypothetical protein VGI16_11430 [Candidatus Acidoferrum sp.]|jgi:hypothetical protein
MTTKQMKKQRSSRLRGMIARIAVELMRRTDGDALFAKTNRKTNLPEVRLRVWLEKRDERSRYLAMVGGFAEQTENDGGYFAVPVSAKAVSTICHNAIA